MTARAASWAPAAALAAAASLAPSLARACPSCAGDATPYAAWIVAAMIAAPYVVVACVVRAIRAGGDEP
jgi:hypothetical protein